MSNIDEELNMAFSSYNYQSVLEEKEKEERLKMLKVLAIGTFLGGLLTAVFNYTCDFFGIDIEDAKDTVVETSVESE